jgi:putative NIF3 family GTP cyclohydrolase 1 type 2
VIKAIQHNIAIYAIHTNLDNVLNHGVNQKIAQKIGLCNCTILRPKDPQEPRIGSGVIGDLPEAIDSVAFLDHLKASMNLNIIKHTALLSRPVQRVALCGGVGSFLLADAKAAGADIFVTADYKYHEFFDADGVITIIDIGHYESEYFTIELLFELLTEKFPKFAARSTKVVTNPINYY